MPAFKTRDDLKIQLNSKCGYKDLKDDKVKTRVTINVPKGSDREEILRTIAKKLSGYGGKFKEKTATNSQLSSTGHVEFNGGYTVVCKIKGGGGSGAGSALTTITESAQCIYLAAGYHQNKTKVKDTAYTKTAFKSANAKFDCDITLDKIIKNVSDDWILSSKLGADLINSKFRNTGKNYVAHRGSSWVKRIDKHFATLNKESGRIFGDINKWSPADIWLVSSKGSSVNFEKTETFLEFNTLLQKNYRSGDIVGISLKKMVGKAQFKNANISKDRTSYEFKDSTLGKVDFFRSADGYLYWESGKMQIRTFGATWQGEIKGKNANMGKVSGGPIARIAKQYLGKQLMLQGELKGRTEKDMELFYKWYSSVPHTKPMTEYDFFVACEEQPYKWYISKIMSTQLVAVLEKSTKKKKTAFVSALLNYASSESELSGPYFKCY